MSAVPPRCRQHSGLLISTPLGSDKAKRTPTVMCCHCGRHHLWVKGSGRKRGYCLRCKAITCGRTECDPCVYIEQVLENLEAGMPYAQARTFRPVRASVPAAPPTSPGGVLLG